MVFDTFTEAYVFICVSLTDVFARPRCISSACGKVVAFGHQRRPSRDQGGPKPSSELRLQGSAVPVQGFIALGFFYSDIGRISRLYAMRRELSDFMGNSVDRSSLVERWP